MARRNPGLAMLAAVALTIGLARPALAQGGEQQELARQATRALLEAMDFSTMISREAEKSIGQSEFTNLRPEWRPLMVESLREEAIADEPQLETLIGQSLAAAFTADELRAGMVILKAPEMRAMLVAMARGEAPPPLGNPPCAADCMAAISSPAGRSFAAKMSKLSNVLTPDLQKRIVVVLVPGFLVRFGEKAKAYDQAHPLP